MFYHFTQKILLTTSLNSPLTLFFPSYLFYPLSNITYWLYADGSPFPLFFGPMLLSSITYYYVILPIALHEHYDYLIVWLIAQIWLGMNLVRVSTSNCCTYTTLGILQQISTIIHLHKTFSSNMTIASTLLTASHTQLYTNVHELIPFL